VLKEGIGEDFANQERLAKLLRFASTHADEGVSFADYVGA
jgi:molecular chaperone HtpG